MTTYREAHSLKDAVAEYAATVAAEHAHNATALREMPPWMREDVLRRFPQEAVSLLVSRQQTLRNEVAVRLAWRTVDLEFCDRLAKAQRNMKLLREFATRTGMTVHAETRLSGVVTPDTLAAIGSTLCETISTRAGELTAATQSESDRLCETLRYEVERLIVADTDLFSELPVGTEGEPADDWLLDAVVEHAFLDQRRKDAMQNRSELAGDPIDARRAGLGTADARRFAAPEFLACPVDDWVRAMKALDLELSRATGKFIWPADLPMWSARTLLDVLQKQRELRVFTRSDLPYCDLFLGLFSTDRRTCQTRKGVEHALTRDQSKSHRRSEQITKRLERAIRALIGRSDSK